MMYLEETAIPKLEKDGSDLETLNHIKNELAALRERRNEVLPLIIPRDPGAFDELVNQVVAYRNRRGGVSSEDFKLPLDLFERLETNQPLLPVPVELEDNEHALLLKIHSEFAQKIDKLRNIPKQNQHALGVADQLSVVLAGAIDTYERNKSNITFTKEQAKIIFMDTCTTAINNTKLVLEKELGWGEYLTNLLKSFANVLIGATNTVRSAMGFQSQYTLFTPAKAPFLPEVEEMERNLYQQFPPNL